MQTFRRSIYENYWRPITSVSVREIFPIYVCTVQTYFSFWLVIGQISAYVWSISSLEIETEREFSETKKSPCIFYVILKWLPKKKQVNNC